MLKNNMVFTQKKGGSAIFKEVKASKASTPTLINPNFDKDFILYTLGGESSISTILTQLNDTNEEKNIAFFSEGLKNYEYKYSYVESIGPLYHKSLKEVQRSFVT